MKLNLLAAIAVTGLMSASCSQDADAPQPTVTPEVRVVESSPVATTEPSPVATGEPTEPPSDDPSATRASTEQPVDYLAFANGAVIVSTSGFTIGGASLAFGIIDGNPETRMLPTNGPVEIVFKLPAETVFESFAIPNVDEPPGVPTFFRDIEIAGSSTGPTDGFRVLVATALNDGESNLLVPAETISVRWVRLRLENGLDGRPPTESATVGFTELIGHGTQVEMTLDESFAGAWEMRLGDKPEQRGQRMQLVQSGPTLTGCVGDVALVGTVNGSIATVIGTNSLSGAHSAYILVPDSTGGLQGVVSVGNGIFGSRIAIRDVGGRGPGCSVAVPDAPTCGAIVYVNFAVDSDSILPASTGVLADLFERVRRQRIPALVVEGHTSTEAGDIYNQELSERRAAAVADDLVRRGLDPDTISATGKGESEPLIFPEFDEAARAINRRVEITCN